MFPMDRRFAGPPRPGGFRAPEETAVQQNTPIHTMAAAAVHCGLVIERIDVGQQIAYAITPDGHKQSLGVSDDVQVRSLLGRLACMLDALEWDSQEYEDAHNAFCELATLVMTGRQRSRWEAWNKKATSPEIVDEALRILGVKDRKSC